MKKRIFGILVAAIALTAAFSFTKPSRFTPEYFLNTGSTETWISQGTIAADQNSTDYTPVAVSFDCPSSSNVCVYIIVNSKYVMWIQGTYVD